ncbi:MAG: type II secretion system protein [Planctomycetota bacterium]|jgi:prepilin-type N-terminal cleavage/methylation domain-containing protein
MTERPTLRRRARAGFTLIELLVVILIIGILSTFLLPRIPEAIEASKVAGSSRNLTEIYRGLATEYPAKFDRRLPNESGVKFFACLIYKGVWENVPSSAKKLTCPGVDIGALTIGDLPEEEWFSDPDVIDGSYSSYAGRDCDQFPLRNTSGKDCWVATDNDGGMNFRTTTLMLMGDGAVERLETYTLIEEGVLDEGEEILFVGPDSQHEELRKLSLD